MVCIFDAGEASAFASQAALEEAAEPQFRRETYFQNVRAHVWRRLEERNRLSVPVNELTDDGKTALVSQLLQKLRDV